MKKDYSQYFLPNSEQARLRTTTKLIKRTLFALPKNIRKIGNSYTFFIKTYGCQSNIRDSETISGLLKSLGFKPALVIEKADLIILNTCAVRENAEKKVFGEIGFLKKIKKTNPNFHFGICGCMSQEETVVNKIIKQMPQVDFIFGTHNIYQLPEILQEVYIHNKRVIQVFSNTGDVIEGLPTYRTNKFKAYVNIMYGCDHFCSYCIVPYTRGQLRSRTKEDILLEVKTLIKNGYQEITLLGQNVNSYGLDLYDTYRFWDLLAEVANTKIKRLRFVTSNPWNFDKKIIDTMKIYSNIMPYIHLPIQSGDETILKQMKRNMKIKDYYDIVSYIRKQLPTCSISTDIIVGFPNESEDQFQNTLKMYHDLQFDNAYTFIYSPRNGTPAALIKDKIDLATKEKHLSQLNELVRLYAKKNNEKWVNKEVEVLVDGPSKSNPNTLTGYSPE
jgi:tRNA-2-methylthio-N6-dimethylallyladenosine synthase